MKKIWKILISGIVSLVISPYIGNYISILYLPYAVSDDQLNNIFAMSTIIVFFILSISIFILLGKIFNNKS